MELIQAERVSAFLGVTTMLNWMMAVENFDGYDISSLRNIQYGGGPMPSRVIEEAMDKFPCTLIQGYGQTEGTTMCFLSQEDHIRAIRDDYRPERLKVVRAGGVRHLGAGRRPRRQRRAHRRQDLGRDHREVRGQHARVLPPARPHRRRPSRTDGCGPATSPRWDDERYVFIVDRAKDMIISGGENIYSVQVEEAIASHPAVLETAVIGVPDDEWGESVHAYVVLKPEMNAEADDIIDTAKAHLASYQKPRTVDFVDELPKAPTGKILKRVLREPHWKERDRQV